MRHASTIVLLVLCALLQAACSDKAVYQQESFASDSPFRLKVDGDVATACESVRRALLGQGYLIARADSDKVEGRKAYRNEGNLNTFIEMTVVCVAEVKGSSLFANGVLSTYDLKKSSSAASVGVSAIGTISLPIGQSADSLVKIGEETITDSQFYNRFFSAVSYTLGEMQAARAAEAADAPAPSQAAPAAPAARAQPPVPEPGPAQSPAPEPGPVQPLQHAAPAPSAEPAGARPAASVPAAAPAIAPETGPAQPAAEPPVVLESPPAEPAPMAPSAEPAPMAPPAEPEPAAPAEVPSAVTEPASAAPIAPAPAEGSGAIPAEPAPAAAPQP